MPGSTPVDRSNVSGIFPLFMHRSLNCQLPFFFFLSIGVPGERGEGRVSGLDACTHTDLLINDKRSKEREIQGWRTTISFRETKELAHFIFLCLFHFRILDGAFLSLFAVSVFQPRCRLQYVVCCSWLSCSTRKQ